MLKGTIRSFLGKLFIGVALAVIASSTSFAQEGQVHMEVNVLERKSTDTMNDFNLSAGADSEGRVLGATTQRAEGPGLYRPLLIYLLTNNPILAILDCVI